jgi:hypothetical protein
MAQDLKTTGKLVDRRQIRLPIVRRWGRWFIMGLAMSVAVLIAVPPVAAWLRGGGPGVWWDVLFFPLALVPWSATILLLARQRRRMVREFAANDGAICTSCLHGLVGLGAKGRCPECGHLFDAEHDAKAWATIGLGPKAGAKTKMTQ